VDDVLAMLPKNFSTVVEYGAGDGVMTRALLERLPVTGKMLAVEMTHD
jgi:phospholipid N-methyltransferase